MRQREAVTRAEFLHHTNRRIEDILREASLEMRNRGLELEIEALDQKLMSARNITEAQAREIEQLKVEIARLERENKEVMNVKNSVASALPLVKEAYQHLRLGLNSGL